ncbi:FAD-binding protein [Rhodobacteraceae bacterium]|nr:FAD-binding protein [Paracoccaceae bacterium]
MNKKESFEKLKNYFGERWSVSRSDIENHGQSESYFPVYAPDAVVYPITTKDVVFLVNICQNAKIPLIGYGVGTSLEGHTAAIKGGISVDFSKMCKVLDIDSYNMSATLEPGVTREQLNTELRHSGLFFSVDPGANATLGGMASTRASGTTTIRYGTMRENIQSLEIVLANGECISTNTKAKKSAAGYDLTSLFIGAEGTLGLITKVTVKLHPIPELITSGVVAFDTISNAVEAVQDITFTGVPVARLEFLDEKSVEAFNAYSQLSLPLKPHLLFELHSSEKSSLGDIENFKFTCSEHGGIQFKCSSKEEERKELWALRHKGYYAILASAPGKRAIVTDICVPQTELGRAVLETQKDISRSGISGPILGHVGDGNFHAILLVDPENPREMKAAKSVANKMANLAISLGGTCTGEHGIGIGKLDFMPAQLGHAWNVMGNIKEALDPSNIMNPGKVIKRN